ncbi:MAG: hypothetical protein AAGD11_09390 [Planctomycetota bacterium]
MNRNRIRKVIVNAMFRNPSMAMLGLALLLPANAFGVELIRDGFGDGDRNNNGLAFEANDGANNIEGDVTGDYTPVGGLGTPLIYPVDTTVIGATTADDVNDTGIRWTSTGGVTDNGAGDPAARPRIINDAAGHMPDTVGSGVGFFNNISGQTETIPALDSGLALGFEGKGRGRSISGFFETDGDYSTKEGTISLGPKVDDEIKVSFDFRVWLSAPNFNTGDSINHVPARGEIRFGLYEDADDQLGQTNLFAGGTGILDAVWGEDDGGFRGDFFGPDASGDPGWFARVPIYDPDAPVNPLFGPFPDGRNARIVQETNADPNSDTTIHLQGSSFSNGGDTDVVALPDQVTPDFVTLENTKRYNIELSLKRFDELGGSTNPADDGDNIEATLTVTDLDNPLDTFSFSGFNALDPEMLDDQAGFFSDAWDYFSITTAGSSDSDELDFVIDNFLIECNGSNCGSSVDTEPDGDIDGADFLALQRTDSSLISQWQSEYPSGASLAAANAVPEPASLVSLCLASLLTLAGARRSQR